MSDVKKNDAGGYNVFLIIYILSLGYRIINHFIIINSSEKKSSILDLLSMFWSFGIFLMVLKGSFIFIIVHVLLVNAYKKAENTTVWSFLMIMWFLIFLATNLVMLMITSIFEKF